MRGMTTETRITIEAKDVLAIEFTCPNCKTQVSIPLKSFSGPPIRCSFCNPEVQKQWLTPGAADYTQLVQLVNALRAFAEPNVNGNLQFGLRLHIRQP